MKKPEREEQIGEDPDGCVEPCARWIYDAEDMDAFLEEQAVKQHEWARAMNIRFIHALKLIGGFRKEFIAGKEELEAIQKELARLTGEEKEARE